MDSAYKKNIKRYSNVVKIARHMLNLMVLFVPSTHIYSEAIVEGCYSLSQLMMYFQNITTYSLGDSGSNAISSRTIYNITLSSTTTSTSGSTSGRSNNPPETTTPDNHPSTYTQRSSNTSFSSKLLREIPICLSFIEVFCEKLICLFFGFHGQSQLIFIIELIKAVSRLTLLMRTNACTMTIHWIQEVDSQGNILDLYNYARHYQRVVYHYLNQQKQKQYDAQRYLSYSHSVQRNNAQNQNQNSLNRSNSNYDFGSFTSSSNSGSTGSEVSTPIEPYIGRRTGITLAGSIPKSPHLTFTSSTTNNQLNAHPQYHSISNQQQQAISVTSSVTADIHNGSSDNLDNDHAYSLASSCETSPHKSLVHLQSLRKNHKNNINSDSSSSNSNNNMVKRTLYDNCEDDKEEDDEVYKAYIRNYDENFIRSSVIPNISGTSSNLLTIPIKQEISDINSNNNSNSHNYVKVNVINDKRNDTSISDNKDIFNTSSTVAISIISDADKSNRCTSSYNDTSNNLNSNNNDNNNNNVNNEISDDILFNGGLVGNNYNTNSDSLLDMNTCITLSESNSFVTADDTYNIETAISTIDTDIAVQNDSSVISDINTGMVGSVVSNGSSNDNLTSTEVPISSSAAAATESSITTTNSTTTTSTNTSNVNSTDYNNSNNSTNNNTFVDFFKYIAGVGIDFTQFCTSFLHTLTPSVKNIYTTSLHTAPLAALQFTQTLCKKSHQNVRNLYEKVTCYKFPLNASQCLQLGEVLYLLRPLIYVWVRHTLNNIKLKKMNKNNSTNESVNDVDSLQSSSGNINLNGSNNDGINSNKTSSSASNNINNAGSSNGNTSTTASSSTKSASDYCEDSKSYRSLVALAVSLVVELLSIQLSSYGLTLIRREVYKNSVHMFSQQYSTSDFDKTQLPSDLPASSSPLHNQHQQQQHKFDLELRRRKQALCYYLIRSPVFDRSLLPLFKLLSRSLKCIPLINTLPDYVLSALVYMNNSHFRSSASSSSSF